MENVPVSAFIGSPSLVYGIMKTFQDAVLSVASRYHGVLHIYILLFCLMFINNHVRAYWMLIFSVFNLSVTTLFLIYDVKYYFTALAFFTLVNI